MNTRINSIRPQDDFFGYVNGSWLKQTKIPADKTSWGAFHQLREVTEQNCLAILDRLLTEELAVGSRNYKIQQLYRLYLNQEQRNAAGIEPLQPLLQQIDAIEELAQLEDWLIKATKSFNFNPLYNWSIFADLNNSDHNAVYFSGPDLGLANDYFQTENPRNSAVLKRYRSYVAQLLQRLGYQQVAARALAKQIVAFEQQLAQKLWTNEQQRDPNLKNYPLATKKLNRMVKQVDLAKYLRKVGVKTKQVILAQRHYFAALDSWLTTDNLALLKVFLKYRLLANAATYLDQELEQLQFAFYQHYLLGQKQPQPLPQRALGFINTAVGEAFGKLYVKQHFPKAAKQQLQQLIDYLQRSFAQRIRQLDWMSTATKQQALHKLASFRSKVGYPDKWRQYKQLKIDATASLYANVQAISNWNYRQKLKKVGKKVDQQAWSMPPQTVNAYYSPLNNEIVFPAGILQPPFFDPGADPATNFGAIGAVIGHEMTHGFDDSGANFDAKGNLVNWWTAQDKQKFAAATAKLARQYSGYQPVKGHFINGVFTLGENIADLGGITIAYDALQLYLREHQPVAPIDGYSQNQRLFISWAKIWRIKSTRQYLINQVKTDPHSPGYYRVIGSLVNLDGFYQAFAVKPRDKMYRRPSQRVRIW